jgi:hypothetical protein
MEQSEFEGQAGQNRVLGIDKPDYSGVEVGKWKPKLGIATYKFEGDSVVTSEYNGKIIKVLKILLVPDYEEKVRTLELTWRDNPGARTNTGRWIMFVRKNGNLIEKGTKFVIYRRTSDKNPDWSEYEFQNQETPKAA